MVGGPPDIGRPELDAAAPGEEVEVAKAEIVDGGKREDRVVGNGKVGDAPLWACRITRD